MVSFPVRSKVFAGRAEELAALQQRVDEFLSGRASCVLIRGEPGIGKTRLTEQLRRQNAGVRFEVLRCRHGEGAERIHEFADRVSNRGPAIVVVEDADRADAQLLDAIATYDDSSFLWIVTFSPPADPANAFEESVARLHVHGAYEVALDVFDDATMGRIVGSYRVNGRRLSRELITRVVQLSAGNPALANEIARAFTSAGAADDAPVPEVLRSRAKALLGRLDSTSRSVVMVASLIGPAFDIDAVRAVAERGEAQVLHALQDATLCGLIRENERGRFSFGHPLLREAVFLEATPSWAAKFHVRIARSLENTSDVESIEARAWHYRRASELDRASEWSNRAAQIFLDRGDYTRAARNFRHASQLPPGDPRRLEALIALARTLRSGGFDGESLRVYDEILADSSIELEEVDRARVLMDTMALSWGNGDMARVDAVASEILAMDIPDESNVKQTTLARLAGFAAGAGRFHETLELIDRLEAYAPLDAFTSAHAAQQRAFAIVGLENFESALPHFRRGVDLARLHGTPAHSQFCCNLGTVALAHGHVPLGMEMLELGFRLARETGISSLSHMAAGSYALGLTRCGQLGEARGILDEIDVRSCDLRGIEAYMLVVPMLMVGAMLEDSELVDCAIELGLLEAALESGESQRIASVVTAFSAHYWYAGESARAQALLHEALPRVLDVRWNHEFCLLIAKYGYEADIPTAREMLARNLHGEKRIADAYLSLFDAHAARRRGRNAEASRAGARAAMLFAELGWPVFEAQAHEVAGDHAHALRLYEAIGDVRDARILSVAMRPMQRGRGQSVGLTKRESAIAELAVRGLSNRQIADQLGIGVRTVEFHLQGVYGKFGVRSRWQIPLDFAASP